MAVTPALLATIALRTAIVLVTLFVGLRLLGKRSVGELNLFDLLLILMIANAVQNSMTEGIGPLAVALVAGATLLVIGWAVAEFLARRPSLERHVMGAPAVLVHHGRLNKRALHREHLEAEEVTAAVREQGLAGLEEVRLAVLEIDGTISVVPEEQSQSR